MNVKLLCTLLFFTQLSAIIIESSDIKEISNHINGYAAKDTIVVFDIDNTLGRVPGGFGGDEWFGLMMQKHLQDNPSSSYDAAAAEILPVQFQILKTVWLEPVQNETPEFIRFLQDNGIRTIALTGRSYTIKKRTVKHLLHMNIDFTYKTIHSTPMELSIRSRAYYDSGIIFSGQNDKGALLSKFFEIIGYHPKKVIFIDDKIKYVESVAKAMEKKGIEYVGIRYTLLDDFVAQVKLEDYEQCLIDFCLSTY